MSMYRKYLLKKNFWAQPKPNSFEPSCYVKHNVETGGIYAYLQHRGVKIVANNESRFFNNFSELDEYLDSLSLRKQHETAEFMHILNRKSISKALRQIPL